VLKFPGTPLNARLLSPEPFRPTVLVHQLGWHKWHFIWFKLIRCQLAFHLQNGRTKKWIEAVPVISYNGLTTTSHLTSTKRPAQVLGQQLKAKFCHLNGDWKVTLCRSSPLLPVPFGLSVCGVLEITKLQLHNIWGIHLGALRARSHSRLSITISGRTENFCTAARLAGTRPSA